MTDVTELDRRLGDLEAVVADLPEMLNLRFGSVTARQDEMAARLGLLDKQISILVRDVRDMRGAVTRQLLAQDQRLSAIEASLQQILAKLP